MKRKYELNLYAPFQYEDIQDHLEEMAERGWELEKASHRLFVYQAAEPGPVRYALAYRPEVGWMDQLPTQGQEIYAGYCQGRRLGAGGHLGQVSPDPDLPQPDEISGPPGDRPDHPLAGAHNVDGSAVYRTPAEQYSHRKPVCHGHRHAADYLPHPGGV